MTNLGEALGALIPAQIVLIIAAVWFMSKVDSRLNENKSMAVRAHKRIDRIEEDLIK
jgi:hypothetical protein